MRSKERGAQYKSDERVCLLTLLLSLLQSCPREDRQYQVVYTDMFLNNRVEDYSKLEADLTKKKELGMYANVEFTVGNLKEYTIEPTDLSKSNNQSPFDSKEESPWDFE